MTEPLGHRFEPPPPTDRWACHEIVGETQDGNPILCARSLREHMDYQTTTFPLEPEDGP